jgi:hypothetical protein
MTCVVKTLLNAQDADVALTRADVYASIMIDAKASDTRAHVYQRKTRIASEAQVNYCLLALKQAKLIDVTTHKARDCEALRIARDKLKDVAL